ncbi:MAG: hypothetical protein PWQ90_1562, partial [Pseudothermotoga sp.]|nr:hypothetical protein [Pseudothermotoga sp.]
EYREELATQVIMALSHVPVPRTIEVLARAYRDDRFAEDVKKDIVQAISMLTMKDPKLWDHFEKIADKELISEVKAFTK